MGRRAWRPVEELNSAQHGDYWTARHFNQCGNSQAEIVASLTTCAATAHIANSGATRQGTNSLTPNRLVRRRMQVVWVAGKTKPPAHPIWEALNAPPVGHHQAELDGAQQRNLLVLLFLFQFPLFLWTKQGLFLLFPLALILASLVAHICFSVIEKEYSSQSRQTSVTFSALGPFGPRPSVYDTRCPSRSSS
jgi:hypothetical protein